MPRTVNEILAHAGELADQFESDDFDGVQLAPAEYALYEAARARAAAETQIAQAVHRARADGITWAKIGNYIGTSGEAARQRYSA